MKPMLQRLANGCMITAPRREVRAMRADIRAELGELVTLRDVLRYCVSQFRASDLYHGHGATNALDEAAFLILETLSLPVDDFASFSESRLTAREKAILGERIALRIETRQPAAYLTGRTYLQGYPFKSDARAIVPRSFIAELLFSELFDGSGQGAALIDDPRGVQRVLDLCTGSGCLAILAAHAFPFATIDAVDLSKAALELARENIAMAGLEGRIQVLEGDLFGPLKGQSYDLILTNPPYVDQETMAMLPQEFRHEPVLALAGGEDGLDLVRIILRDAPAFLREGGGILCEIGLGRDILEEEYPNLPFFWLDTEESEGEVFWITRQDLLAK
jgi:ribosomal protein L3 glutamine methyltransferase